MATWHASGGDPSALAVLDDGRVVASGSSDRLSVWDALGDGSSRTVVPGRSETAIQHLDADAAGTKVLLDSPSSFEDVPVVDLESGATVASFRATDPGGPPSSLPPVTWTTTMNPAADVVAAFDLAGRGFAFDGTDGHLLTGLSGGHTSLVSEAGFTSAGTLLTASVDGSLRVWDPDPADEQVNGSMTDNLCRVFGARIDDDSWEVAFGDDDLDSPCPAAEQPSPSPLAASTSADVGAVPPSRRPARSCCRTPSTPPPRRSRPASSRSARAR